MAWRKVLFVVCVVAGFGCFHGRCILGAEPAAAKWNPKLAAEYLDGRGESWFKFSSANRGEERHCRIASVATVFCLTRWLVPAFVGSRMKNRPPSGRRKPSNS